MLSHYSCIWLFATLRMVASQAPFSMGILQLRIVELVAMPSSRGSFWSRDRTRVSYVSCTAGRFFTTSATWEPHILSALVTLTHLFLKAFIWGGYYYCPCFTDEETEAQASYLSRESSAESSF